MPYMTQAAIHARLMQSIWCGIVDDDSPATPEYEDANDAALAMGAKPTGGNKGPDDEDAAEWLFPDGSTAIIQRNGSGIH